MTGNNSCTSINKNLESCLYPMPQSFWMHGGIGKRLPQFPGNLDLERITEPCAVAPESFSLFIVHGTIDRSCANAEAYPKDQPIVLEFQ